MTWSKESKLSTGHSLNYEIRLQGRLDEEWSGWLDSMSISYEDNATILRGRVIDQAALRGILNRIWDLNRTVISVSEVREPPT
jgi:hypothetical protein